MISIEQIIKAHQRLKPIVKRTAFHKSDNLSDKYNANIFLKREDQQVVRSFKIRGAYNKMATLSKDDLQKGIVCASAGNHAQGVAFACNALKTKGMIFMPSTTPKQKIGKVRQFGNDWIEVVLTGDTFDDAYAAARAYEADKGAVFIHPFNDDEVIAGQGTIALEMLQDIDVDLDFLLVAIGGGGLISGVGSYFRAISPNTKIIGIESAGAPAMHESIKNKVVTKLSEIDYFADGIAVQKVGDRTYEITKDIIEDLVLIPEGKICATMLELYNEEGIIVEPSGAISISALDEYADKIKHKNVAVIICGGNNDITRTEEVRERALLYEGKKQYFIINFPQRAGALREFLDILGEHDDITHFEYTKKTSRDTGPALVGIELKQKSDFHDLVSRMNEAKINYQAINDNPMMFRMLV